MNLILALAQAAGEALASIERAYSTGRQSAPTGERIASLEESVEVLVAATFEHEEMP